MTKIIKRICFITIVFLTAISIKAYANELTLECQDSINLETENALEYTLKGNFTENVNSIKVRYKVPEGVEFEGFTPSENWNLEQGGTSGTTGLILRIDNSDVIGEVEFGKFIFNVPSSYNKKTITLKIYDLDATNTSCDVIEFDPEEYAKSVTNVQGKEEEQNNENNDNSGSGVNNSENNNENNSEKTDVDIEDKTTINEENSSNINKSTYIQEERGQDATVSKTPFG